MFCGIKRHIVSLSNLKSKSDGLCRRRSRQASERPFLYALPPVSQMPAAVRSNYRFQRRRGNTPRSAPECIGLKKAGMRPAFFVFDCSTKRVCAHILSVLALSGSLGLFLALNARFFVVFSFAQLCLYAALEIRPFESAKRAVYRFVFFDLDLSHCHFPSSLRNFRPQMRAAPFWIRSLYQKGTGLSTVIFGLPA